MAKFADRIGKIAEALSAVTRKSSAALSAVIRKSKVLS